jgi:hypothetical protein
MSLLLNGAKTMTFAGTEMQCLEIYTGEAYTIGLNFTNAGGSPIDTANWTINASAKFYTVDTVEYPTPDEVVLGNITLDPSPQPNVADYTLLADWSNTSAGTGYLYIGADITGNGTTPTVDLANTTANSVLVITTIEITRESEANASLDNVNKEPVGFIVRYQ